MLFDRQKFGLEDVVDISELCGVSCAGVSLSQCSYISVGETFAHDATGNEVECVFSPKERLEEPTKSERIERIYELGPVCQM